MLALKKPDVTTDEDPTDIDRAVSGDVEAFERLYNRHVGRVQGLARWLLGREDVEDVVQDIFIRVWQKLGTFKGKSSFATWLHRLATNVILRRRQQSRAHDTRHSELNDDHDGHAPRSSPELRVDIEHAVRRLPERAREVFVLHDMAGYKHEEIARELGISAGTSRSQLHHARMALRQYLAA